MAKNPTKPAPKKGKAQPKNNTSGNSKKKPAASKMITTLSELESMTLGEVGKSMNRIDWDATDFNYDCEPYNPKYDVAHEHEAFIVNRNGKRIFIGDTKALPMAELAERNPALFLAQLIAYKRLNVNLSALNKK